MNLKDLIAKMDSIEEGIEVIGGPIPMPHPEQPSTVTMNVSMNGSGADGIKSLMAVLRDIENGGDAPLNSAPHHAHSQGSEEEPIIGDMVQAMASEEMDESSVNFDEEEVEQLLRRFDENMNERGGYGDPDYRKIFHALRIGDVESAVEEVWNSYSDQDGGEIRMDDAIEDLEANLKHIIHGSVDENSMEQPAQDVGIEEVIGDDRETWGNSVHGDAGHHVHGVDAVTQTGDDMNSKGKISPLARAPGTNAMRHPMHEQIAERLQSLYSSIKEERTEEKNEKGEVVRWKEEGEWKKAEKKDGRGKVTNLSDKARRESEKLSKKEPEKMDESVSQMLALNKRLNG